MLTVVYDKARLWHRAHRFLRHSEPCETRFTCDVVSSGDVALDIGANKGAYSYWMTKRVGRAGRVYAFEPQPELADYLRRIAQSLSKRNLQVCQVALSDQNGTGRMVVPAHCWGSLEITDNQSGHPELEVPLVRLDDYLESNMARRPVSFIKCDVEGHEAAVFRGAERVLTEDRPVLLFETAPLMHMDAVTHPVFCFLKQLGYIGYFFWLRELIHIDDYRPDIHKLTNYNIQNYVFLHSATCRLTSSRAPYSIQRI